MPRLKVKALLLGLVAHFGSLLLLGTVFLLIDLIRLQPQHIPPREIAQHIIADRSVFTVSLFLRLVCLGTGAFVTARIARTAEFTHATILWLLVVLLGLLPRLNPNAPLPPGWFLHILYVVELPVALLGALIARRMRDTASERGAA